MSVNPLTQLTEHYYRAWFRYHPEIATDLGVSGYGHLLRAYDEDDIGALKALNEKLIMSLDELSLEQLSQDQQIDVQLMRGAALIEMERQAEFDWRKTNPESFIPIHAIYQLTVRDLEKHAPDLQQRLAIIPDYLRGARSWLMSEPEQIPALWLENAIAEAEGGVNFVRELKNHPVLQRLRLNQALDQAAHALEEFATFLQRDIGARAQGEFACGRKFFELILQERHFLEIDADTLFAFGENLFNQTEAALRQVTQELQGNDDIHALTARIQANHPPANRLLDSYRENMEAAKAFVTQQQLVSMPSQESLKVVETPIFLQHQIPFAAYYEPPANDPQQRGFYYVSPPQTPADEGEHNYVSIKHTSVHEAWPGHHLQFVTANQSAVASSWPRLTNASATFYEGWALYCEGLMAEQGFLTEPESRFVLLKDRLWRALRVMLDVNLHCRGMSLAQAAQLMQDKLGFSRHQAMADLSWYTQAPGVPMGYATGWALISNLRSHLQQQPDFNLRQFHDTLLASGSVALPLAIVRGFGVTSWRQVSQKVFKNG